MIFIDALRYAIRQYKKQKQLLKQKRKLLSSNTDMSFLEEIVKRVNDNPHLKVTITLKDGTVLQLRCFDESRQPKDWELLDEIIIG